MSTSNDTREALAAEVAYLKNEVARLYAHTDLRGWRPASLRDAIYRSVDRLAALTEQPAAPQQALADAIHYPDCWDTAAYPTLASALSEIAADFRCTNQDTCAAPQAWQSLTEGERDQVVSDLVEYGTAFVAPRYAVIEGVERKLMERNAPAPAAPQASHLGDSVERCGSPSGAVSGGSASQVPHGWVSVDEGRPDEFGTYLVWLTDVQDAGWDTGRAWTASWSGVHGWEGCVPMEDGCEVTHWMPLPKPPVAMGHVGQEPSLDASVAGPEARPDQQRDSCAAPQALTAAKVRASIESAINVARKFDAAAQEPQPPARGERELIRETIGLGFEPGELQTVNADDLLRLVRAASSPAPAVQPTSEAVAELVEAGQPTYTEQQIADACVEADSKFESLLIALHDAWQPQGGSNG